jgi:predicted nucleic acid-binding protein
MKLLLDTDVLLDIAFARSEFFEDSARVLEWAEAAPGQAAVAWHSLSNLAYLVRPDVRPFLRELLQFVEVAPVSTEEARRALTLALNDVEDALQIAAAQSFGASFIISRNLTHYRRSPIPALTPKQFLETHVRTED